MGALPRVCLAAETGSSVPQLSRRPTTARPRLDPAAACVVVEVPGQLGNPALRSRERCGTRRSDGPGGLRLLNLRPRQAPTRFGTAVCAGWFWSGWRAVDRWIHATMFAWCAASCTWSGCRMSPNRPTNCCARADQAMFAREGRRQERRARCALPLTRVPLYGAGAGRPTVEVDAERRPRSAR